MIERKNDGAGFQVRSPSKNKTNKIFFIGMFLPSLKLSTTLNLTFFLKKEGKLAGLKVTLHRNIEK